MTGARLVQADYAPRSRGPEAPPNTLSIEEIRMRTENTAAVAAERRADYVRALNEERAMCERAGKADRVDAIDAELDRVEASPSERKAPATVTAAPPAAPEDPTAGKRDAAAARAASAIEEQREQAQAQAEAPAVAPADPAPAKKAAAKKAPAKKV